MILLHTPVWGRHERFCQRLATAGQKFAKPWQGSADAVAGGEPQ